MTHPVSEATIAGLFFGALMFASKSNIVFICLGFLRQLQIPVTRKLKESLAVEMCGVEEYRNLSEMFHFSFHLSFSEMNSGIFVASFFFFFFCLPLKEFWLN